MAFVQVEAVGHEQSIVSTTKSIGPDGHAGGAQPLKPHLPARLQTTHPLH